MNWSRVVRPYCCDQLPGNKVGFWHTKLGHSVEHVASNLRLSFLCIKISCLQFLSKYLFVSIECVLSSTLFSVAWYFFPSFSPDFGHHLNGSIPLLPWTGHTGSDITAERRGGMTILISGVPILPNVS